MKPIRCGKCTGIVGYQPDACDLDGLCEGCLKGEQRARRASVRTHFKRAQTALPMEVRPVRKPDFAKEFQNQQGDGHGISRT